ncbi:MAG: plastocyanin/azurin family copper-binding protein [Gemmatimonadota bacterium]
MTAAIGALTLSLLLSGCGSDSSTAPDETDPGETVATTSVGVRDNFFDPTAIRVAGGATINWTWNGSQQHNVTWVSADLPNSPTQSSGTHQVVAPSSAGELVYFCTIHGSPTSGMRGTVRIE